MRYTAGPEEILFPVGRKVRLLMLSVRRSVRIQQSGGGVSKQSSVCVGVEGGGIDFHSGCSTADHTLRELREMTQPPSADLYGPPEWASASPRPSPAVNRRESKALAAPLRQNHTDSFPVCRKRHRDPEPSGTESRTVFTSFPQSFRFKRRRPRFHQEAFCMSQIQSRADLS